MAHTILPFHNLAHIFVELEKTSSNLAMIAILAGFFKTASADDARIAAYLIGGKIAPDYEGIEFGIAKKLALRAIAIAYETPAPELERHLRRTGDLGSVVAEIAPQQRRATLALREVFTELRALAELAGTGSQEKKFEALALLLRRATAEEAKYLVRIVLGALRLGIAEMTFLSALALATTGSRDAKKTLEQGFNVLADIGEVAYRAVKDGAESLADARPVLGVPVRMMLAERVAELADVPEHIPGAVLVEYKYDGERLQAHISATGDIVIFSRRHENITHQFPDVVAALKSGFGGKSAIVEGEVVAIDKKTGAMLPFQVLMQRRRKNDIEKYVLSVPVRYILFDLLHLDGQSLLAKPLDERKQLLQKSFRSGGAIAYADALRTEELAEIESFFTDATRRGAEGVMIKDAGSHYEAGKRGWRWIKFKKDYADSLVDTFDLVVIGGLYGAGRRAGSYGSLLVAVYDPSDGRYYSCTKVGAGFTDADLAALTKKLNQLRLKEKHRLVETGMKPDMWFSPELVMEVSAAELTVSPIHSAARAKLKRGGLALRFPRFLRWRDDKNPTQATTVEEIYNLYRRAHKAKKR